MFILTKNDVILNIAPVVQYFYIGHSGYYMPCSFSTATHFLMGDRLYETSDFVTYRVGEVPVGFGLDGTWYYDKEFKEIKRKEQKTSKNILKKAKEFLDVHRKGEFFEYQG